MSRNVSLWLLASWMAVLPFGLVTQAQAGRQVHKKAAQAHVPYTPPFASLVVDGATGKVLAAQNPDAPRHPASITKVMTLYLLFEQLEAHRLSLSSPIILSARAASMAPSKLGAEPGTSLSVEEAIKAVVTKSANDVAVAIAETIAGSEERFAQMMTTRARSLGMSHTTYVNASGLPAAEQITTARDLALLGRAIKERFPQYYAYFSTSSFSYAGMEMKNHNKLLGQVEGVDGIKTGYTSASGFNLLTSAQKDGRRIIAVILGGKSAQARDHLMAELVETYLENSTRHVAMKAPAPLPESRGKRESELASAPTAEEEEGDANPTALPAPHMRMNLKGDTKTEKREAKLSPPPVPIRVASLSEEIPAKAVHLKWVPGPSPIVPMPPTSLVQLQVGTAKDEARAQALIAKARAASRQILASAAISTDKIVKEGETMWRARFLGLQAQKAEKACQDLKKTGISCFQVKN